MALGNDFGTLVMPLAKVVGVLVGLFSAALAVGAVVFRAGSWRKENEALKDRVDALEKKQQHDDWELHHGLREAVDNMHERMDSIAKDLHYMRGVVESALKKG